MGHLSKYLCLIMCLWILRWILIIKAHLHLINDDEVCGKLACPKKWVEKTCIKNLCGLKLKIYTYYTIGTLTHLKLIPSSPNI